MIAIVAIAPGVMLQRLWMEAIVSVLGFDVIPIINSFALVGPRMMAMKS